MSAGMNDDAKHLYLCIWSADLPLLTPRSVVAIQYKYNISKLLETVWSLDKINSHNILFALMPIDDCLTLLFVMSLLDGINISSVSIM